MKLKYFLFIASALLGGSAFAQSADTTMLVNGVCDMCKKTIENACDLDGIEQAEWTVESKILTLRYDPSVIRFDEISEAINKAGYDTELNAAAQEHYEALDPCCHYRDPEVIKAH